MDNEQSGPVVTASNSGVPEHHAPKAVDDDVSVGRVEIVITALCGSLFWLYGFINVFILNTDNLIQDAIPSGLEWLVSYKVLLILVCASVAWLALGTKQFLFSSAIIIFFPIVILAIALWKLGKRLLESRSWILVLAAIEIATATLTNFKMKFILSTLSIVSMTYILVGDSEQLLSVSAIIIFLLVIISFVTSFMSAISPPSTFGLMQRFLDKEEEVRFKSFRLDDGLRGKSVDLLSPAEVTKWNNVLQNSIIYNRSMLFYARTMRDYQRSNLLFIPGIFTIFRLTTLTVVGFSLVNFAVFKVYPDSYKALPDSGIFNFFYYSFNALVLNGIDDVKPAKMLAQSLLMIQELLSFVLAVILVSLFVSYRTQRASSDLDKAIEVAEKEASSIESWLQKEFKIASVNIAIQHLRQAEGSLINFIHWLSKGI